MIKRVFLKMRDLIFSWRPFTFQIVLVPFFMVLRYGIHSEVIQTDLGNSRFKELVSFDFAKIIKIVINACSDLRFLGKSV